MWLLIILFTFRGLIEFIWLTFASVLWRVLLCYFNDFLFHCWLVCITDDSMFFSVFRWVSTISLHHRHKLFLRRLNFFEVDFFMAQNIIIAIYEDIFKPFKSFLIQHVLICFWALVENIIRRIFNFTVKIRWIVGFIYGLLAQDIWLWHYCNSEIRVWIMLRILQWVIQLMA